MQALHINRWKISLALSILGALQLPKPIGAIARGAKTLTLPSSTLVLAESKTTQPCKPSDLTAIAQGWSSGEGALGGNIFFQNKSNKLCSLYVLVRLQILDARGQVLPIYHLNTSGFWGTPIKNNYALKPKDSMGALIAWHNWCRAKPKGSLRLRITLPANQGQLTLPIATSKGTPLDATPKCENPKKSSALQLQYLTSQSRKN